MSSKKSHIYQVGYRQLPDGRRLLSPVWPIAAMFVKTRLAHRATKILMIVAGGVFLLHLSWLFLQLIGQKVAGPTTTLNGVQAVNFIGGTQDVLTRFLSTQFFVAAVISGIIGGGVIADERHSGSLHVYFSRPVNRTQFIAGKVCGVLTIPIVAYILPTVILWLFALGLSPPVARIAVLQTGPSAILIACVGGILIATTVAAVSALVTRARTASVLYAAGLIALTAIAESSVAVGQTWVGYLSPERLLRTLVLAFHGPNSAVINQVFGTINANQSALLSGLSLALMMGISITLLAQASRGDIDA